MSFDTLKVQKASCPGVREFGNRFALLCFASVHLMLKTVVESGDLLKLLGRS